MLASPCTTLLCVVRHTLLIAALGIPLQKMLGQRPGTVGVVVNDEMFGMLCEGLEMQYGEHPQALWDRESVTAATVELEYQFGNYLSVSPYRHDWSRIKGDHPPETGVGNFTDCAAEIMKCLASTLMPCFFGHEISEASGADSGALAVGRYSFKAESPEDGTTSAAGDQMVAVRWLLDNFADRFALTAGTRSVLQLLMFASKMHISARYLMHLKEMLQLITAMSASLSTNEWDVFNAIMNHVGRVLTSLFHCYKSSFRPSPDMEITTQLSLDVLSLVVNDPEDRLQESFAQWPHRLMSLLSHGARVAHDGSWQPGSSALSISDIIHILDAILLDINLDDTEYRFSFDSVNVADKVVAEWAKIVPPLVSFALSETNLPDSSQILMKFFLETRALVHQMEVVSPDSHELWASFDIYTTFRSPLAVHLRAEQVRIDGYVARMIREDHWTAQAEVQYDVDEQFTPLHSVSASDILDCLITSVQPLSECWRFGDIASLVGQVLQGYSTKCAELCETEIRAALAQHKKSSGDRSADSLVLPSRFWVRINNIQHVSTEGLFALCDQTCEGEDSEVFRAGLFSCKGRIKDQLRELIDIYVDHHCDRLSGLITRGLMPKPTQIQKTSWLKTSKKKSTESAVDQLLKDPWKQLRTFLDSILDQPAQLVYKKVFQKILKRLADGFSSTFEAIVLGDEPVGVNLGNCVEQLQLCLHEVSQFFYAGGVGLDERVVDRVLSISSRLGKVVQFHAFEDDALMRLVESLSAVREENSELEEDHRILALRVLATRKTKGIVQKFVSKHLHNELSGTPAAAQVTHQAEAEPVVDHMLWGTTFDTASCLAKIRGGQSEPAAVSGSKSIGWGLVRQATEEVVVLEYLKAYLQGSDPLGAACDQAHEGVDPYAAVASEGSSASAVLVDSELRKQTFRCSMAVLASVSMRARPGQYVVLKRATIREHRHRKSAKAGTLDEGDVVRVTDVEREDDGTVRVAFDVAGARQWTSAVTSSGRMLLQRIAPVALTANSGDLLQRSLIPSKFRRQRKISRTVSKRLLQPTSSGSDETTTGFSGENALSSSEEDAVPVVWFTIGDATLQHFERSPSQISSPADDEGCMSESWRPFSFAECQQIERELCRVCFLCLSFSSQKPSHTQSVHSYSRRPAPQHRCA